MGDGLARALAGVVRQVEWRRQKCTSEEGQLLRRCMADESYTPNADDATALHVACHRGFPECVQLLVSAGANLALQTSAGESPLHVACGAGDAAAAALLIERGAPLDLATADGATPLLSACVSGSGQCVELLLAAGAAANLGAEIVPPLHVSTRTFDPLPAHHAMWPLVAAPRLSHLPEKTGHADRM